MNIKLFNELLIKLINLNSTIHKVEYQVNSVCQLSKLWKDNLQELFDKVLMLEEKKLKL
jgi:hypothetical protein